MEITLVIDEANFEKPVREAVARAINEVVTKQADKKIYDIRNQIESAVEKYIANHFNEQKLSDMIAGAIAQIVNNKIDYDS